MDKRLRVLLDLLEEHSGEYVSGSEIARALGVSKPTINRLINMLRSRGFIIESNPRKGYRLVSADNLANAELYLADLEASLDYRVYYVEKCISTQDIASALAEQGAHEGTIVLAEEMSGGRGRLGRKWYALRGGLWFTLILRPRVVKDAQLLSLAVGLGLVKGIEKHLGTKTSLKWPNDVLYDERKLAGILVEGKIESNYIKYILVGIGLNVNNEIPAELRSTAISLKEIKGKSIPRIPLLRSILLQIDHYYVTLFEKKDYEEILSEWKKYSTTIGRTVKAVTIDGRIIVGKAVDVDKNGALVIETSHGLEKIYAGDLEHLR